MTEAAHPVAARALESALSPSEKNVQVLVLLLVQRQAGEWVLWEAGTGVGGLEGMVRPEWGWSKRGC